MVLSSYIIDFLNAKDSTYYAFGGKNSCCFVFSGCKTQNPCFFRLSLQRWGLFHRVGLDFRIFLRKRRALQVLPASSYGGYTGALEFRSQCCILLFYEYGRFNITIITITTPWCTRGVGKTRFQQSEHDTLRDRRKGDPQHKCYGNKNMYRKLEAQRCRFSKSAYYFLCNLVSEISIFDGFSARLQF